MPIPFVPALRHPTQLSLGLTATDNLGGSANAKPRIRLLPVVNWAPQVERIDVDPGVAYSGETVQIIGVAIDADNDVLQTRWQQGEADDGVKLGLRDVEMANASFVVPALESLVSVDIEWRVSDGREYSVARRRLQLLPREQISPNPLSCLMGPLQPGPCQ